MFLPLALDFIHQFLCLLSHSDLASLQDFFVHNLGIVYLWGVFGCVDSDGDLAGIQIQGPGGVFEFVGYSFTCYRVGCVQIGLLVLVHEKL